MSSLVELCLMVCLALVALGLAVVFLLASSHALALTALWIAGLIFLGELTSA